MSLCCVYPLGGCVSLVPALFPVLRLPSSLTPPTPGYVSLALSCSRAVHLVEPPDSAVGVRVLPSSPEPSRGTRFARRLSTGRDASDGPRARGPSECDMLMKHSGPVTFCPWSLPNGCADRSTSFCCGWTGVGRPRSYNIGFTTSNG